MIFFPPIGIDFLLSPMRHVPRFFASLRMTRPAGGGVVEEKGSEV